MKPGPITHTKWPNWEYNGHRSAVESINLPRLASDVEVPSLLPFPLSLALPFCRSPVWSNLLPKALCLGTNFPLSNGLPSDCRKRQFELTSPQTEMRVGLGQHHSRREIIFPSISLWKDVLNISEEIDDIASWYKTCDASTSEAENAFYVVWGDSFLYQSWNSWLQLHTLDASRKWYRQVQWAARTASSPIPRHYMFAPCRPSILTDDHDGG